MKTNDSDLFGIPPSAAFDSVPIKKELKFSAHRYHVYFPTDFGSDYFGELCHTLRTSNPDDEFYFYLANFGGSVHTLVNLVSAIRAAKAKVIKMIVTSPCYSCGAALALSGTDLEMARDTFLLFHNYSTQESGKAGEAIQAMMNHNTWITKFLRRTHTPFLTKEECEDIDNDRDLYIHAGERSTQERINRHFKKGKYSKEVTDGHKDKQRESEGKKYTKRGDKTIKKVLSDIE